MLLLLLLLLLRPEERGKRMDQMRGRHGVGMRRQACRTGRGLLRGSRQCMGVRGRHLLGKGRGLTLRPSNRRMVEPMLMR